MDLRTFNIKLMQVSDTKGSVEVPSAMQLMGVVLHESSNYKSGTAVFVQAMPTAAEQKALDEHEARIKQMGDLQVFSRPVQTDQPDVPEEFEFEVDSE